MSLYYRTVVADPPWQVKAGPACGAEGFAGKGPTRNLAYPAMTVGQIAALPVSDLAPADAHLYLWTINRYVREAHEIASAWGFTYSTTLVWAKTTMGGGLGGAFGISTEFVLFCRRGRPYVRRREPRTWFDWKRPYDERGKPRHSAKPEAFFDLVERVSEGPYLELFARTQRLGWHTWGNEALNHVALASPTVGSGHSDAAERSPQDVSGPKGGAA